MGRASLAQASFLKQGLRPCLHTSRTSRGLITVTTRKNYLFGWDRALKREAEPENLPARTWDYQAGAAAVRMTAAKEIGK